MVTCKDITRTTEGFVVLTPNFGGPGAVYASHGLRWTRMKMKLCRRPSLPDILEERKHSDSVRTRGVGRDYQIGGEAGRGKKMTSVFINCNHMQIKRKLRLKRTYFLGTYIETLVH